MLRLAAALALLAGPALADQLSLNEVSRYLNGLTSAKADFRQFNDDGTRSSGTFYLKRPGRMRFEYDPPEEAVVVAGGGAVVIFDPKSDGAAETYPLQRTPLSLILDRTVDLNRANMVVGHGYDGTYTIVAAQDPENPEYGYIEMMFTDAPVRLARWRVTDSAGAQTTVDLGPLDTNARIGDILFNTQLIDEPPGR